MFKQIHYFAIASLLIISFPAISLADVTIERVTKFGGFKGMGANETVEKNYVRGLQKRTESTQKFTGSFLSAFTGESVTISIIKIKKDQMIEIDHEDQTYSIRPITIPKDQYDRAKSKGDGKRGDSRPAKGEKPRTKVIKNEMKVKKTDEKKEINGFSCRRYILTWEVVTKDLESGVISTNLMTNDMWNTKMTGRLKKVKKEEFAFNKAFMKRMGLKVSKMEMERFGFGTIGFLTGLSHRDIMRKLIKIGGFSIASNVKWETKSENPEGEKSRGNEEDDEDSDSGLAGGLEGMLGGFMKKAMSDDKDDGMSELFQTYTEVKSVDASSIPKTTFVVPEGYREVE